MIIYHVWLILEFQCRRRLSRDGLQFRRWQVGYFKYIYTFFLIKLLVNLKMYALRFLFFSFSIIDFCVILLFLDIGTSWKAKILSPLKRSNTRRFLVHLIIVISIRWVITKVKLPLRFLLFSFSIIDFSVILLFLEIGKSWKAKILSLLNTRLFFVHLFIVISIRWVITKANLPLRLLLFSFSIIDFCVILLFLEIGISWRQ